VGLKPRSGMYTVHRPIDKSVQPKSTLLNTVCAAGLYRTLWLILFMPRVRGCRMAVSPARYIIELHACSRSRSLRRSPRMGFGRGPASGAVWPGSMRRRSPVSTRCETAWLAGSRFPGAFYSDRP